MLDNIHSGPDAAVAHSLALLRAATFDRAVQPQTALVAGITLSVDPDVVVKGTVSSKPGDLVSLRLTPEGPTRWISLNIALGPIDLRGRQWLGLVCSARAPQATTFRVMLRSGVDGGYIDSYFRKTVAAYAEPSTHLDAIDLGTDPKVPRGATWREVILMFEPAALTLDLLNFGVFLA